MAKRIAIAVVLFLVATSRLYAHDSDRMERLEREVQEIKKRLSELESIIRDKNDNKELVITNDGWKSVANWRKLNTGMSPSAVLKILGDAHRIDGGNITIWYYENGGDVMFYNGKVERWSEPR